MGRRKRAFLDDGDSDSSAGSELDETPGNFDDADPDARAERELFENPYRQKRRRPNGKEDALYGVFAEDSEDEGFGRKKQKAEPSKRRDWAKAPAFVSSKTDVKETTEIDMEMQMGPEEVEEEGVGAEELDGEEDEDENEEMEEDESEPSRAPSPRVRDEEEEEEEEAERPRVGGLGLGASKTKPPTSFSGFTKSGIGASRPAATSQSPAPSPAPAQATPLPPNLPSAFGASTRIQRAFVRDNAGSSETSRAATPLPAAEQRHFSKLQSTFGARMLAKMGWQAGTGLGASGAGIVTPVETKLRPKGMGIAFRGFTERTAQAKLEAKRRGEAVSEEEEEEEEGPRKPRKGKVGEQVKKSDAWKKPKKVKTKVVYKTYEEIVAEAGQEAGSAGVGIIIDATGATPREVASLAEVSMASWTPSTEAERIPEVRHNLRLIVDAAKGDLDALAREAKEIQQRRAVIQAEDLRLRKKVEEEAELISRLQQVHLIADDIKSQARELASVYEATLEPFSPHFEKLLAQFPREFEKYRLDEIVVAAIAPIVRRMLSQWSPLEDPNALLPTFRRWRRALKLSDNEQKAPRTEIDIYGGRTVQEVTPVVEVPMTPFESLLWNAWLPKPAVRLYEAWSTFLPPFIKDNILDQLILPKVSQAVADWSRKETVSLKTLVFPWLPHVGLRLEDVLNDARRKLKGILRSWTATEAIPKDLATWREVFNAGDWDAMLLKYVVPKLGATLREDFTINPRQQDMAPLRRVLDWEPLLRPSILAQLLESGFFPKWLDVLHIWLTQPRPSFEEVAQWYAYWKSVFSENVQNLPAVKDGFTGGLQLMNKAIELGPDAPTKLPKPDHHRRRDELPPAKAKKVPARVQEITFRSIVEEFAAAHNLMFVPTGRAHELSRMPLYRVSQTADGKGGVLVYILDDAVWAPNAEGDYRAISLETMALRATKGGA
ncbi:hypothetical protein EWM64_g5918 [Hericium alpestre]|uniref:G-patch domain-containing protein n=1 Tax=Hericium alpestre TaxID=135208 RepID=A0A4Y9ZU31_9AGAM|nr:hypothetical protein EWM64_g5918 [Hericium alpestre]